MQLLDLYNKFSSEIFKKKYAVDGETWEKAVERIVEAIQPKLYKDRIKKLMKNKAFIPGGRIIFGAGREGTKATLLNCYNIPITDDSIEGIFKWLGEMAKTYSYGGGVGTDLSRLRPKGSPVSNSARYSTGAVSFMNLASVTTDTIGQMGRRGALLLAMRVDHPDIEDFLKIKSELYEEWAKSIYNTIKGRLGDSVEEAVLQIIEKALTEAQVKRANISVIITNEFMEAVKENKPFKLRFEFPDGKYPPIEREVNARELFRKIAERAWRFGEPGVLFIDNAKAESNSEYFAPVTCTNPCGEIFLEDYGCCNLGSLNLVSFYDPMTKDFDFPEFERAVQAGIVFLDAVVDYNLDRHPLPQQTESHRRGRRLGLGVMGLADLLFLKGYKFNDLANPESEAYKFVEKIAQTMAITAYKTSIELADQFGPYPAFDREGMMKSRFMQRIYNLLPEKYKKMFDEKGIRNVALLSIAPTGTISLLAGVSSSIEPMFSLYMKRWSESLGKEELIVYPTVVSILENYVKMNYPDKDLETLDTSEILALIDEMKMRLPYLETTEDVSIDARIENTKIWQTYVDNSISQTINLPNSATVEEVEKIYMRAWESGLKGITIYRTGSRDVEVLRKVRKPEKKEKEEENGKNGFLNIRVPKRPFVLEARTYKVKYEDNNYYVTVTYDKNTRSPLEVFVNTNAMDEISWWVALSQLLSAVLRRLALVGEDYSFLIEGLKNVKAVGKQGEVFYGYLIPSKPAILARVLEWFKKNVDVEAEYEKTLSSALMTKPIISVKNTGVFSISSSDVVSTCPNCGRAIVSDRKYPFDCDHPCPYCGYTGTKCGGE
jgi:ribonucleoside-diphosphate reductase alpha chain